MIPRWGQDRRWEPLVGKELYGQSRPLMQQSRHQDNPFLICA